MPINRGSKPSENIFDILRAAEEKNQADMDVNPFATKPEMEKVEAEEAKLNLAALEDEVVASVHTYVFKYGEMVPQRPMNEEA